MLCLNPLAAMLLAALGFVLCVWYGHLSIDRLAPGVQAASQLPGLVGHLL